MKIMENQKKPPVYKKDENILEKLKLLLSEYWHYDQDDCLIKSVPKKPKDDMIKRALKLGVTQNEIEEYGFFAAVSYKITGCT